MPVAAIFWLASGTGRGRRAAYRTQFLSPCDGAHLGIKRIEAQLGKKQDDEALYKSKWATEARTWKKIETWIIAGFAGDGGISS